MKRKYFSILLAAMTIAASVNVYGAPSIGQIEPPRVIEGNLSNNQELIMQRPNTDAYQNTTVAETVKKANDDTVQTTVKEILNDLNVDTTKTVRTETGQIVNPSAYEMLSTFVDVAIKEGDKITYESTGKIKTTLTMEAAKDVKKKDVLLMQINQETGKVSFVAVEKLDAKTGEITVTLNDLGPVALMEKVPIVSKDTSPEKYSDKKVADAAEKLKNEKSGFKMEDFIKELTVIDEKKEIQISEDKTINLDDYVSATSLLDLAIKMGNDYSYDMSGSLLAEVNCDIDKVDWKSLVTANDPNFDTDEAEKNLELLTELDPFVIKDSVAVQADAITGELNYLVEPELSFAYPQEEEADEEETENSADSSDSTGENDSQTKETDDAAVANNEKQSDVSAENPDTESGQTQDEEETDEYELMHWIVEDEDKKDEQQPNLVIKGEFKGMGPLAVFIRKTK